MRSVKISTTLSESEILSLNDPLGKIDKNLSKNIMLLPEWTPTYGHLWKYCGAEFLALSRKVTILAFPDISEQTSNGGLKTSDGTSLHQIGKTYLLPMN